MAVDRRKRGQAVEAAARELLRRAGLTDLAANALYRVGELDLVMRDATRPGTPTVVFVEVRYRQSQLFGGGAASVDAGKRRRLVHAALRFLQEHPALADAPCRFDVIDAQGDPAAPRLTWIRDAFRADEI
ncbi:MAG TPA: YraN family protein [Pseudoxanthomonas sp.]|uniref:YraN family protein n=1 Tax=Pseudoxanthomonas sp. SE1 TaxID=1664560 RepID=UPI00240D00CC|nr:YraN family protein [Pseudoxanthomonas sp. SE1]WFC41260.1 YraN family protein [Pseudoxanthomonas sp. SE1]HJS34176.1 YraN family protein [Pseudoxanthomonas sp.]